MTASPEIIASARKHWDAVAGRLGLADGVFDALAEAYGEPHRRYHTLDHIVEMLDCLAASVQPADDADAVGLAIWFHDVVYDTRLPHGANEAASADRLAASCAGPAATAAHAMILHSAHHGPSDDADTRLFCDLDLYRLAGSYETFQRHGADVRAEYGWVDDHAWAAGRGKFFADMQARATIYQTAYWHGRLEDQARDNLARATAEM